MVTCWICSVDVTEENAVGKRSNGSFVGICIPCNKVYSLVRSLIKLSDKELEASLKKSKRRKIIHQVVTDHKNDLPTGEITKEAARRLGYVL